MPPEWIPVRIKCRERVPVEIEDQDGWTSVSWKECPFETEGLYRERLGFVLELNPDTEAILKKHHLESLPSESALMGHSKLDVHVEEQKIGEISAHRDKVFLFGSLH